MEGWRGRGALALVLLFVVSLLLTAPLTSAPSARSAAPGPVRASATVITLRETARDSQFQEVNWTRTQDSCFSHYDVYDSGIGASGPWNNVGTGTDPNVTSADALLPFPNPGASLWWYVNDTPCSGPTVQSNILHAIFPNPSPLTYVWVNDTGVRLTWGNNYTYGGDGALVFLRYDVYEAVNGGAVSAILTLSPVSNVSTSLVLPASSSVDLYVETVDSCTMCYSLLTGNTNMLTLTTTAPVAAVASGTPPTSEVGVPVAFSCAASSGASPYTYAWDFGDGTHGTGANVSHTYTTAGTKDAVCTATDAHAGTATAHASVTVNPGLSVAASGSATSVAPGTAIVFNATASGGTGGPYTIHWDFGDGATGTGAVATHTYTTPGTYIPTVTVTDALGGTVTKALTAITVAAPSSGLGDLALYGGIGVIAVVAVVAVAFLLLRKRKRGPASPPGAAPPPPSP